MTFELSVTSSIGPASSTGSAPIVNFGDVFKCDENVGRWVAQNNQDMQDEEDEDDFEVVETRDIGTFNNNVTC